MDALSKHYSLLLGLDDSWRVVDVDLSLEEQRVEIRLEAEPAGCRCAGCHARRPLQDHAPERSWRHLDTMQFETVLVARIPRTDCPDCGVKTCEVPWAKPHGRFTLMFEAFAIRVLQAAASVEQARRLLNLSWRSVQRVMDRAVERGLERRELDEIEHLGLDEKSFRKGQDYVTVLTDIDGSRVLEVAPGRDEAAADQALESLSEEQRANIAAVAMDMSASYENSVAKHLPEADIVHDRFHISKHFNEAVDKVRRTEHQRLMAQGDETLKGTRQMWLFNPENLRDSQWDRFERLRDLELKTARAYALREHFRWIWEYRSIGVARKFFDRWYAWASRCRLKPMTKVARMLKRRLDNILTWFRHRISNGLAEGYNSRIQSIKSAARGFRDFYNYRTRILFYCGKLKLLPETGH